MIYDLKDILEDIWETEVIQLTLILFSFFFFAPVYLVVFIFSPSFYKLSTANNRKNTFSALFLFSAISFLDIMLYLDIYSEYIR